VCSVTNLQWAVPPQNEMGPPQQVQVGTPVARTSLIYRSIVGRLLKLVESARFRTWYTPSSTVPPHCQWANANRPTSTNR